MPITDCIDRLTKTNNVSRGTKTLPRAGFTLVELLVVIGIVALLISILLPTLARARQASKQIACLSNVRQQVTGITFFANDYEQKLPPALFGGGDVPGGAWGVATLKYIGAGNGTFDDSPSETDKIREVFKCPDSNVVQTEFTEINHYSSHPILMPNSTINNYPGGHPYRVDPGPNFRTPYKTTQIKGSSEKVLTMDGAQFPTGNARADAYAIDWQRIANPGPPSDAPAGFTYPASFLIVGQDPSNTDLTSSVDGGPNIDLPGNANPNRADGNIRWRHMGGTAAVFSFVDGHAESLSYRDRWNTELKRSNVYVDYSRRVTQRVPYDPYK